MTINSIIMISQFDKANETTTKFWQIPNTTPESVVISLKVFRY